MAIDQAAATLATAGATLAVGLLVAFIAYRQWAVARTKLKLDLFEKRYALYRRIEKALQPNVRLEDWSDEMSLLYMLTETRFLFSRAMAEELLKTYKWKINTSIPAIGTSEYLAEGGQEQRHKALAELHRRATVIDKIAFPYLDFSNWK